MNLFESVANLPNDERRLYKQEKLILWVTERIAEVMEEKGIRQIDLAESLDVSKARVSKMLAGDANITLRTLADICDALGVPVNINIDDHVRKQLDALAQEVWNLNERVEKISLQATATTAKKQLLSHVKWAPQQPQNRTTGAYQPVAPGISNVVSLPMSGKAA